jgi:hypothetical protein
MVSGIDGVAELASMALTTFGGVALSRTVSTTEKLPPAVALPLRRRVVGLNVSPAGSVLALTE